MGKKIDELAVHLGGISLSDAAAIDERTEDEKIFAGIMGKGVTYYFSGESEKALSMFEAAINIEPAHYEAWYNKGIVLADLGRTNEAVEAFSKTIKIKPNNNKAWYNLACLYSVRDFLITWKIIPRRS